jgi:hypothetical protein
VLDDAHQLQDVRLPDTVPSIELAKGSEFSMAAGEFVEIYSGQKGSFSRFLSLFFFFRF